MKRAYVTLLMALIAISVVNSAETKKDKLVIAVQSLPMVGFDAMTENSNVALRINYSVEETLLKTDYYDGYKIKAGLAESWTVSDSSKLVLKLRKGIKFHNGEELTADDVAFTFGPERFLSEKAPGRAVAGSFLSNLKSVTAIDRYTVKIQMKDKDALLVTRFANFPSQIISKKAYLAAKSFEDFGRMPVGTGPYKVVEYTDGTRVVLERFDGYWGAEKAAVKTLVFQLVPELSTRIAGLRTGEFDIITEVPPDQATAVGKMPNAKVVGGPIANIYGMFFDEVNDSPMKDPRIRKALSLAIDRQKLVKTLFGGLTTVPANWQMEQFGEIYLKDYPGVPFDQNAAKALLKEAGYNGKPIVYRILPGYYTLEQTVAEAVVQMWRDVGINVDLRVMENWTQINEDNAERHIINASFSAYYPDPVGQFWRRFGANSGKDGGVFWNNSAEFNRLGKVLETNSDLKVRRDTFKAMLDIFTNDPKGLYLYSLPMIYGTSKTLTWSPLPVEGMDFSIKAFTKK